MENIAILCDIQGNDEICNHDKNIIGCNYEHRLLKTGMIQE